MSLQLNLPVADFKELYGPNNEQMPRLITGKDAAGEDIYLVT